MARFVLAQAGADVTRPTFWKIGHLGEAIFYYLAAVAIVIFAFGVYQRFATYAAGEADWFDRLDDLGGRIVSAVKIVASNEKQFNRDLYGGLMHAFIFWGFLTLLIGTTILMVDMDLWTKGLGQESFFQGAFYLSYSLVMDAMGLLFVVGVGMAIYRRYWVANHRLWGRHTSLEDDLFVWTLFLLGVGGYVTEGVRILGTSATRDVSFETVSFVGWFVYDVLLALGVTPAMAEAVYPITWWSHAILALVFVATIPYAKPFHMISSFANVVTRDEKAGKRLPGVPEDASPEEIGHSSIEDFSWKELLDHDACTKCGRCSSVCPAKASNRPLDPRDVILDLKRYREDRDAGRVEDIPIVADTTVEETYSPSGITEAATDGGTATDGGVATGDSVIASETMEACMSCMACMDACPVEIEHVEQFTQMNRRLTESGQMDANVQDTMMNVFQKGNTFGDPQRKRADWTDDLDFEVPDAREESVEFLWYVGDYPSFDERNKRVARSLATIFDESGVSYGILYDDEQADGNDVRRVGEEGLYEMLVEDNAAAIQDCDFDKIVCTDPHSYNTFKNEYPEFEACEWTENDVFHYTQVVEEIFRSGYLNLTGNELDYVVTYHDPCHLGRYNDEYEAPREIVTATGCTLDEMPRNRDNSFCCGGGGGGLWMDFEEDPKPSEERLREALNDTDMGGAVEKFVVACPMCMTMYEDGRKTGDYEDDIEIVDVSELLVEAIGRKDQIAVSAD
ncbi:MULTISPECIES: heterodisulfide reductase-related iron-sulfur binding cluster [Halorussus]|uniref:heterodisulfide reductase-related iron-sulfur binding cluster n=1 Tax=Halorussus TaxID=1070314 RepID=UPI00209CE45C|nr:heterodisulfide reductase-related iron-sulfur binding cluster [Halorussus vallis]USZ74099.1 heterodisulfide reductase-related iron-sulfur binding cluster [Halorussus vallis]